MRRIFMTFYLLILLTMGVIFFSFDPLFNWYYESYFKEDFDVYLSDMAKGTFHLLEEDLKKIPRNRWAERIKTVAPFFGYPLALQPIGSITLPSDAQARLRAGRYVVNWKEECILHRMGRTETALLMGPIPDFERTRHFKRAEWAVLLTFLVLMGMVALAWVTPLWRNLKTIMGAATRFGRGDLAARASVSRHSTLSPLAQSFNAMADRIKRLIDSRKMLLNAVSHELRTPASRIRFGLEMADTDDPEARGKFLRGISEDVNELDNMVSELLLYARFDRENPELLVEEIPTLEWLNRLAEKWENKREGILFHIHKEGMPATVHGDHRYLTRALENLVSNAVRHTLTRVDIFLHVQNDHYFLQVEDDGPGIPENERIHVFEPFVRLDESRNRISGGHGLGLAIARQIMEWHKGTATAESSRSGGARLVLFWPR